LEKAQKNPSKKWYTLVPMALFIIVAIIFAINFDITKMNDFYR